MPKHLLFATALTLIAGALAGQTTLVDYLPSEADFPNPERGFYRYTATYSSNYQALDSAELAAWRQLHQPDGANYSIYSTLVFRYFFLEDFKSGPIAQPYLDAMAQDFAAARQAAVKVIVRFAYTEDPDAGGCTFCPPYGDAPKNIVLGHITQLKPVLQANADVIAVVQMGFVGIWGEGYYTDYFGDASQAPYGLSAQNWLDRKELADSLLSALPPSRCIQVRYAQMKQKFVYGADAPLSAAPTTAAEAGQNTPKARIGFHNDCFLASADDFGTFADYDIGGAGSDTATLKPYWAADAQFVPVGGETCNDWNPYSNCSAQPGGGADTEMERLHYSYLNADYNHAVNNDWSAGACMTDIRKRLGYRLVLKHGEYTSAAQPGQSISVRIALQNTGYAAPFNPRAVRLLLRRPTDGAVYHAELPDDPRRWLSGMDTWTLEHQICLPANLPPGSYELLLHLADPYPALRERPEYAIRLANSGDVWEPASGYNRLLHILDVNTTAPGTACNGELAFSAEGTSDAGILHTGLLTLFPNPTRSQVWLRLPVLSEAPARYVWFDALGRLVGEGQLQPPGDEQSVEVPPGPPGVLMLMVQLRDGQVFGGRVMRE
ncbi:MAG: DUF4832 domain-containing protein [Saprospiraceae bacterium]|nr:DUF4832 domain-containing protein [Saprospiraceae bacterium]